MAVTVSLPTKPLNVPTVTAPGAAVPSYARDAIDVADIDNAFAEMVRLAGTYVIA